MIKDRDELATLAGGGDYRRVEIKRVVSAPIEKVWSAITNAEEVKKWWAGGEIDGREGGRIRLGCEEDACEGDGMALDGVIKVFQPPHIFEFTWNEAYKPAQGLVRFDLVEVEGGRTQITLVQSVPSKDVIGAAAGWHEITERLGDYAESGEPAPVSEDDARFKQLRALYEEAVG